MLTQIHKNWSFMKLFVLSKSYVEGDKSSLRGRASKLMHAKLSGSLILCKTLLPKRLPLMMMSYDLSWLAVHFVRDTCFRRVWKMTISTRWNIFSFNTSIIYQNKFFGHLAQFQVYGHFNDFLFFIYPVYGKTLYKKMLPVLHTVRITTKYD